MSQSIWVVVISKLNCEILPCLLETCLRVQVLGGPMIPRSYRCVFNSVSLFN